MLADGDGWGAAPPEDGRGGAPFLWDVEGEDMAANEDLTRRLEAAWHEVVGAVHELRGEVKHGLTSVQKQIDEHARETMRRLDEHARELYGTGAGDPGIKIRTDRIERSVGQLLWLGSGVGMALMGVLLTMYVPACERIMQEHGSRSGSRPGGE
jgi:hypothetical protein